MNMPFELPALPWSPDALEPHMSARTLSFHHGKHHATYVSKLNAAVDGTPLAKRTLEDIIRETAGKTDRTAIFNNAAQAWNHNFFWHSLSPEGGGEPSGSLAKQLVASFGGLDAFKTAFADKAAGLFGSGWTWLVADKGKLEIVQTANAGTPLSDGKKPLLTLDVWEHAYYLDFQNRRPDFIKVFLEELVNWDFAEENLAA
jgi:superoxide dismutase, Fe-Mn family